MHLLFVGDVMLGRLVNRTLQGHSNLYRLVFLTISL